MEALIKLKKQRKKKVYTIEQLSKLNTKRLLAFYKKDRKDYFRFVGGGWCECCGEPMVDIYPDDEYYTKERPQIEKEWRGFLDEIKNVLDSREHVEK